MKDPSHLDVFLHEQGLGDIPGNAVQDEMVACRDKFSGIHSLADRLVPEAYGHLVGHKPSLAGVFQERRTQFACSIQGTEYITAGAVVKSRYFSEDLALCPFAAAGSAENQDGAIS